MPIYHPTMVYLIYFLVGYVFRPFVIAHRGGSQLWDYVGITPSYADLRYALFVNTSCLFAFVSAPFIFLRGALSSLPTVRSELSVGNPRGFVICAAALTLLGLYGSAAGYQGGIADGNSVEALSDIDGRGGQRLIEVSGYQTALAEFLPALILVIALVYGASATTCISSVLYVMLKLWLSTAGRKGVLVVLIGVSLIVLARNGRRYPSFAMITLALASLTVFDVVGANRAVVQQLFYGDTSLSEVLDSYIADRGDQALMSDVSEFDVSSILYSVIPSLTGYNYGSQYLRLFLWPIPRQIWADKPVMTDIIDINTIGNFFGLTWSIHSDFYSNFGLLSAIILMACLGLLLYWIYRNVARTNNSYAIVTFWMMLVYLPIVFRDGPVSAIYYIGFCCIAGFTLVRCGRLSAQPKLVFP